MQQLPTPMLRILPPQVQCVPPPVLVRVSVEGVPLIQKIGDRELDRYGLATTIVRWVSAREDDKSGASAVAVFACCLLATI